MSSAYKSTVGGKLKLKQPGRASGEPKPAAAARAVAPAQLVGSKRKAEEEVVEENAGSASSSSSASATVDAGKTAAQLRFEEAQRKRMKEIAKKQASKSHRERVEDLNKLLETTPEHYDLFRISFAGTG